MEHTAQILRAMSQHVVRVEIFVNQGIPVSMEPVHAQQARPPMVRAYVQREIYYVMEYALTKPSMIIIAVGVDMLVPADHFAQKGPVSTIPM